MFGFPFTCEIDFFTVVFYHYLFLSYLYSLGKFNFKWSDLTSDLKKDLEAAIVSENGHLNHQNMYMLLYGLRRLGIKKDDLSVKTRFSLSACFERSVDLMDEKSLSNSIQG